MTRHPQLAGLERELHDVTSRVERLGARATGETFHRQPGPGRWSAAECIVHLSLTTLAYLPLIDRALREGRRAEVVRLEARSPGRFRRDLIGWLLCRLNEPPIRRRMRTVPLFVPDSTGSRPELLAEFRQLQSALIERIEDGEGLDLTRLRVTSPFDRRVRYHLYSCFRVLAAHQRRHLWQAEVALGAVTALRPTG